MRKSQKILTSNCRNKRLQCCDRWKFFDQPVKKDLRTYDNIRKIATGQVDDYPNKVIARDLSKQQKLDADPKAMQQINFTGNFFHYWRSERHQFRFFTSNPRSIVILFCLNMTWI